MLPKGFWHTFRSSHEKKRGCFFLDDRVDVFQSPRDGPWNIHQLPSFIYHYLQRGLFEINPRGCRIGISEPSNVSIYLGLVPFSVVAPMKVYF